MKIGDKVRVKSLEKVLTLEGVEHYDDVDKPWIAELMLEYFGKEGLITSCNENEDCMVSFDGDEWEFKKEWLELISATGVEEIKNPAYDDLKHLFIDAKDIAGGSVSLNVSAGYEPADLYDIVERPKHYNVFDREVIDTIKDLLENNDNYKGFDGYCIGNSLKYIFRAGMKGDYYEDLEKARYYLNKILDGKENQ